MDREEAASAQTLGTGHGEREWAPVTRTGFVRATRTPAQVAQLRYDDYRTLVARGVLPRQPEHRWRGNGPEAFPQGFVADPPR
jgi:molybdopterin synthase catalytic subunit